MTKEDYDKDIVHPNEQGNRKIAKIWYKAIKNDVFQINDKGDKNYVAPIRVKALSLDKTEMTLNTGEAVTLKASVNPENSEVFTVLWSSTDETKATVSNNGKVSALKEGEVKITATSLDGKKQAVCNVKVVKKADKTIYQQLLKESFGDTSVWEGDIDSFGTSGMVVNFSGEVKSVTSKQQFTVGDEFVLSMGYQVSGNEGRKYNMYSSFSFGDYEVRIYDGAASAALYKNKKVIGKNDGEYTSASNAYVLKYKQGILSVTRGGEMLIEVEDEMTTKTSAVTIRNGEGYRSSIIKNIILKVPA